MKWSWVLLTFNRPDTVIEAFETNLAKAGREPDQLIWVDNGSDDENFLKMEEVLKPHASVVVSNRENLGVSKGYNRGMVLATEELMCITGCDRIMPMDWADRMVGAFEKVENMGCVSCYSGDFNSIGDRFKSDVFKQSDIEMLKALPFEARMMRRNLLREVGYFHEGFGLYGLEDLLWGPRFLKVAEEQNLLCVTFPDFKAIHLGDAQRYVPLNDSKAYREFKDKESKEPWKWELVQKLANEGYPYFNPFV